MCGFCVVSVLLAEHCKMLAGCKKCGVAATNYGDTDRQDVTYACEEMLRGKKKLACMCLLCLNNEIHVEMYVEIE